MERCEELQRIIDGFQKHRIAFTAIGDETRQLILLVLLQSNLSGIRVGEIAEKTHLTRPSVSHHLKILNEAGIVAMRSEGTKNYYYLSADETKWKDISELVATVYSAIPHMDKEEQYDHLLFGNR